MFLAAPIPLPVLALQFLNNPQVKLMTTLPITPHGGIKVLHLILFVSVLCSIVPIAFVGWQLISINTDTLQGKEKNYQVQSVRNKARQIELYVQGYIAQVNSYARAFEITGNLVQALSPVGQENLARTLEDDSNLLALAVAQSKDLNNFSVVTNSNKIVPEEVREALNEAATATSKGKSYLGSPRILQTYREPALIVARPVKSNGNIEGIVLAVVSLQKVFSLVAQNGNLDEWKLLHGENTIFFVVDGEGNVVAHPDEQLAFKKQDARYLKVVYDWLDSNPYVAATSAFPLARNGETLRLLGSYATAQLNPEQRLGVIGLVNEDAAYLSAQKMRWRTIMISMVVALFAILGSFFFARSFSTPIEKLAENARAIAKGDYARRIDLQTSNREISELAIDFNLMSEEIQRHIQEIKAQSEKNRRLFLGSVKSLAAAIDGKDPYTRGHSERVMIYSETIAKLMNLPPDEVEKIRVSALLHDVGKIGIEDKILRKPAALTNDEFEKMKAHPSIGGLIMSENPEMAEYIPGMSMHHETMDGKGYPLGLKGEQIPMMARIVSVADCFDAMTTNRPYQKAMTFEVAIDRINTFIGTRYDENVVRALEQAIHKKHIHPIPGVNNVPEPEMNTEASVKTAG
jgi:HD-GYP domain-containing protein (c-di-GMP phosphodiesterase class II)